MERISLAYLLLYSFGLVRADENLLNSSYGHLPSTYGNPEPANGEGCSCQSNVIIVENGSSFKQTPELCAASCTGKCKVTVTAT